jgi:hypothetical protein
LATQKKLSETGKQSLGNKFGIFQRIEIINLLEAANLRSGKKPLRILTPSSGPIRQTEITRLVKSERSDVNHCKNRHLLSC